MPLLDGRSLARLNACARAFGKKDEASGRSFCENVARERVLPLMRAHLAGVRSIGGENPERLNQDFLTRFYELLALEGDDLFPPDGCTTPHWPHRWDVPPARLRRCAPRLRCLRSRTGGRVGRRERHSSVGGRGHADLPAREPAARRCRSRCRSTRPARRHPRAAGPLQCRHIHTHEHSCGRRGSICARRKPGGSSWAWDRTWESAAPAKKGLTAGARPSRVSGARSKRDSSLSELDAEQQVEFALPASARLQPRRTSTAHEFFSALITPDWDEDEESFAPPFLMLGREKAYLGGLYLISPSQSSVVVLLRLARRVEVRVRPALPSIFQEALELRQVLVGRHLLGVRREQPLQLVALRLAARGARPRRRPPSGH